MVPRVCLSVARIRSVRTSKGRVAFSLKPTPLATPELVPSIGGRYLSP